MEAPSAWAYGPERGLESPIQKEDLTVYDDEATFYPDLVSNEILRDKVQSSGYGYATPGIDPINGTLLVPESNSRIIEQNDAELTFKPALVQSPVAKSLRKQAPSSGYGKRLPTTALKMKEQKENAIRKTRSTVDVDGRPLFKPQINPPLKGMPVRKKKSGGPPACAVVKSKPKVPVEVLSFKPDLKTKNSKHARQYQSTSSGYGKKVPTKYVYQTAADGTVTRVPIEAWVKPAGDPPIQRHTLLMDKADPVAELEPEVPWVVDGIKMAHQDPLYSKHVSRSSPIKEISAMEPAQRGDVYAGIPSTRYGEAIPACRIFTATEDGIIAPVIIDPVEERAARAEAREAEQARQWTSAKSGGIEPLNSYVLQDEAQLILDSSRRQLEADATASSGYGKIFPEPKHPPKQCEVTRAFTTPKATGQLMPTPERYTTKDNAHINRNAISAKYGIAFPKCVARPNRPETPIWLPPSKHADLPKPDPVVHNKMTDLVLSHYGPEYDPDDEAAYYDDGASASEDGVDANPTDGATTGEGGIVLDEDEEEEGDGINYDADELAGESEGDEQDVY